MSTSIEVRDIGPVEEFAYELNEPGVHVLEGSQGMGKTTILRTAQLATDGRTDVRPTKRDGARRGSATIAGRTLTVMRHVKQEGDLEVEGLGDLDLAGLHSPKFAEAATRDRHRIKALVRLSGVSADLSLFRDIADRQEEFDQVVDPADVQTDDLVEMCGKVKRLFDKAALSQERKAEEEDAHRRAQQELCDGVNLEDPCDQDQLQQALADAVSAHSAMVERSRAADDAVLAHHAAQDKLQEMRAGYDGPSLPDAEEAYRLANESRHAAAQAVQDLEVKLADAKRDLDAKTESSEKSHEVIERVRSHEESLREFQEIVDAGLPADAPKAGDIADAQEAVNRATTALSHAGKVREAREAKQRADQHAARSTEAQEAGERFRDAAASTQDVLTDSIGRIENCPLRVQIDQDGDARLVLATDRSDAEPFDDLSDGERWDTILPLCASRNRLIVLPQAAWGELAPETRARIHRLAQQIGCYVLTAQADDGELRAELYRPELEAAAV